MKTATPRESQYQKNFDDIASQGPVVLGPMGSHVWRTDPRRLGICLARAKFVAKMFYGLPDAIEIGCGDGFAVGVVAQEVTYVHGLDFDPLFVEAAKKQWQDNPHMHFFEADMLDEALRPSQQYAGLYSLDVFEHIAPAKEHLFLQNCCRFLRDDGIAIIGCPTLESQQYASIWSKQGHVNCKSGYDFKALLSQYFRHTFLFGMNDEVVHTGYSKMAHYHFILCTDPLKIN